ncbi:hypothetical protein Tco_1554094 [Tanacetum coccineum]
MGNVKKSIAKRTCYQRQYDRRVNKRHMQTQERKIDMGKAVDADLVVTESDGTKSEVQDDSGKSGNDTDADDADIRPIYDEELMAEVQLTAECNILAIGQQHTEQPEIINEGRVEQYKNIEQTTSLLANNADLKAQIQEKVFAIAALKYGIWKLKGNSVDTKFTKTPVLGKPVLQSLINQSIVRHPNAFKSERPQISKPRFSSQVDVNNNLSRLVTQHYLPKRKESAFAKLDHMIASSSSRNSSKNMPGFSSNDMVHNHYLEEAKKKTQEINKNSKSSVMHTASPQTTTKEVNSRKKTQFNKIRNTNKPVEQKSHTQKPIRQIFKGHTFSPNKTSVVYEKISLRSDLRWKPTGRIFKPVGLRWVPTGKILASCTSKADSESTHGSNVDISKIYKCKQTLDLSAGTSINVQKEKSFVNAVVPADSSSSIPADNVPADRDRIC